MLNNKDVRLYRSSKLRSRKETRRTLIYPFFERSRIRSRHVIVSRIFHQIFRICHVATPSGKIRTLCFARLIVTVGKLHRVSRLAGRP